MTPVGSSPTRPDPPQAVAPSRATASVAAPTGLPGTERYSEDEREEIEELKRTDREVRRHEAAHMATAGSYGGAAAYSYAVGPDGRRYAVAGDVPIDLSPIANDPAATVRKMEQIARAALAPADPSGADQAVAATARALAARARQELRESERTADAAADPAVPAAPGRPYAFAASSRRGALLDTSA